MGETLETLHHLQVVEQKRATIRRALEIKNKQIELKRRALRKAEERLKEQVLAVRELQSKVDSLTLDVASRDESVVRHREALNKAKTNKEYAAILSAMNTEKADNSRQEGDALKLMEDLRLLREGTAVIEADRAKYLQEVAAAEEAVASYERDCKGELDRLQATREKWGPKVVAGALSVFTRIAERHDGEALAAVTKPFPKREEFACSGCNMKVTLDIVNTLRTRDDIQLCMVCGRILYLETATMKPAGD